MPDWACKQKLRGWVEVVFTVMPNGRVTDVKLINMRPDSITATWRRKEIEEIAEFDPLTGKTLKRHDKAFEYKTYDDEPHGFLRYETEMDWMRRTERFFDWYLRL